MPNNPYGTVPGSKNDPEGKKIPLTPDKVPTPEWYKDNFDTYPSIGDELNYREKLTNEGYLLPDQDQTKSSVDYNEAVTNNTFSKESIYKTLKEFYNNSYYKLMANNRDNVHFHKWEGNISDGKIPTFPEYISFQVPWDCFDIYPNKRGKFKVSQFYHEWLSPTELANNSNSFGFMILMFIDQRIISDYQIWIEEQYAVIRIPYHEYYEKHNSSVYLYRFDTCFTKRIQISKELCENQWNWKIPLSYINDDELYRHNKIMAAINRIDHDTEGDNLEFLDIDLENKCIDLSNISEFNKDIIVSEFEGYLWLTLMIPKFMHEYSQLLPVDIVYRPYVPNLRSVNTLYNSIPTHTKVDLKNNIDDGHNLSVDYNDYYLKDYNGWTFMTRPIILSDSGHDYEEPYDLVESDVNDFLQLIEIFNQSWTSFRDFLRDPTQIKDKEVFEEYLRNIEKTSKDLYNYYIKFLDDRLCPRDKNIEREFKKLWYSITQFIAYIPGKLKVISVIYDIDPIKVKTDLNGDINNIRNIVIDFGSDTEIPEITNEFFLNCEDIENKLYYYPNLFSVGDIVKSIKDKRIWDTPLYPEDVTRYYRPISSDDFWIFEYDKDKLVWRPVSKNIKHYYPDAYMIEPKADEASSTNSVYKAFFFYSDTLNTRDIIDEKIDNNPKYDDQFLEYAHKHAYLFDMMIQKFYWIGLEFVYPGLLQTKSKWELFEYIKDNPGYQRYTKLFTETIEPHYKLGLATYLKSGDDQFPFDAAINKMREAIKLKWNDYDRIHNYQLYLDYQWEESYYDYIIRILDDVDVEWRNLYRQDLMFDLENMMSTIKNIYTELKPNNDEYISNLNEVLEELQFNGYSIDIGSIHSLIKLIENFDYYFKYIIDYIDIFDKPIVSMKEMNWINDQLKLYSSKVDEISDLSNKIQANVIESDVTFQNFKYMFDIQDIYEKELIEYVDRVITSRNHIDIDDYLSSGFNIVNEFNLFKYPWSIELRNKRTEVLENLWNLMNYKNKNDIHGIPETTQALDYIEAITVSISEFKNDIRIYWNDRKYNEDKTLLDLFQLEIESHDRLTKAIPNYYQEKEILSNCISEIKIIMNKFDTSLFVEDEMEYYQNIQKYLNEILNESEYLTSKHDLPMTLALSNIEQELIYWFNYLGIESDVFDAIKTLIVEFEDRIEIMRKFEYREINALIMLFDKANEPFVPEGKFNDYMSVYSPVSCELVPNYGGIHYKLEDELYTSGVGVFTITNVDDNGVILNIQPDENFYNKYFIDPTYYQYYYTLTNDIGIGAFIQCNESKRDYIINDEIAVSIIAKCLSFANDLNRLTNSINPYNNENISSSIERMQNTIDEWNEKLDRYGNNMSESLINSINDGIEILLILIDECNVFMEKRSHVDVVKLINQYRVLIDIFKSANNKYPWKDQEDALMLFQTMERIYDELFEFYGKGKTWDSEEKLNDIMDSILLRINELNYILADQPSGYDKYVPDVQKARDDVILTIDDIRRYIPLLPEERNKILETCKEINNIFEPLDYANIKGVEWFAIYETFVANPGDGNYVVGDIVSCTDLNLLYQVTRLDEENNVVLVRPIANYALDKQVWGYHETKTLRGHGSGLAIDIHSKSMKSNGAGSVDGSFIPDPDQYRNQDLMKFKFQNIHDLDMNYEIFAGGIQITDFEQRHEDNVYHEPRKLDVLYLNSNIINNLKNSHLYIKPDQYFIYKIDSFVIKDPGMGFHVNQDIYLDGESYCLKLQVAKLVYHPYKGIEEISLVDGKLIYERTDPGGEDFVTIPDQMNNIDDEYHVSDYDWLTQEPNPKPGSYGDEIRYDDLSDDDRNKYWMYRFVDMPENQYPYGKYIGNGDPDFHFYLGDRLNLLGDDYERWFGLVDVEELIHPQIPDVNRQDQRLNEVDKQNIISEYQLIERLRIWNNGAPLPHSDFEFAKKDQRPIYSSECPGIVKGSTVAISEDLSHRAHRWIYTVIAIDNSGYIFYDDGVIADALWNKFYIDWMNVDYYPDIPSLSAQYPGIKWHDVSSYKDAEDMISRRMYKQEYVPIENKTSYIHNMTINDIAVFNWTTKEWEDLSDSSRWLLEVRDDPENKDWGFKLTFLKSDSYDYDMKLYLVKSHDSQQRNQRLVKPAIIDIYSSIIDEVVIPEQRIEVNTSRATRIRKLFPYTQIEEYSINNEHKEMIFDFPPYMHWRNEIHAEDIVIYNKTENKFEDPMDDNKWEICIKDEHRNDHGRENIKHIKEIVLSKRGESYSNGKAFGWDSNFEICIFADIKCDIENDGSIQDIKITHVSNQPMEGIYQFSISQSMTSGMDAVVLIEFETLDDVLQNDDGYIHNITNPLAPIKEGFKLIPKQTISDTIEYEISIRKTTTKYLYIRPEWEVTPTFEIPNVSYPSDRFYILINNRRFPLTNCSTKRPSLNITRHENGTSVQFLNLYKKYERFEIRTLPYPTRTVYVQRKIPVHGYIDLSGKLNKPLDKTHYEFWVNGKLLYDEVSIITPTKIILHGLTSLKNLEILEINRDYNEYFADELLECVIDDQTLVPTPVYNMRTYLDDVFDGLLLDDNYTLAEQEKLLAPIWKQVPRDHPDYKDYPENIDSERDILLRVYSPEDLPLPNLDGGSYQYLIIDAPSIEGYVLDQRNLKWEGTGFRPMDDQLIVDILNDVFNDDIKNDPYFDPFVVITTNMYYGAAVIMYDEFGMRTDDLNSACYKIYDENIIAINDKTKSVSIINT